MRSLKKEGGFSLIELNIVVGMLLMLTVLGVVGYGNTIKNARVAAVQKAADEVLTGAVAYDSNGGNYKDAEIEWMKTRGEPTIKVEVNKINNCFIVNAVDLRYSDISITRSTSNCNVSKNGFVKPVVEDVPELVKPPLETNSSSPFDEDDWRSDVISLQVEAENIKPRVKIYAPIALRVPEGSENISVGIDRAEIIGHSFANASKYRVSIYDPNKGSCSANSFTNSSDYIVGGVNSNVNFSNTGKLINVDSVPVHLCFEISMPMGSANAFKGKEYNVKWNITPRVEQT